MTLQSSGTIRWSDIRDEFGANINNTEVSLGRYRNTSSAFSHKDVGDMTDLPLDIGVPKSGTIKASDFYSKKLNVVVDLHSQPNNTTRQDIRGRWNSNNVQVIGGYRGRPSSGSNVRVIAHINKTIGSEVGGTKRCAVRTGSWESNTSLEIDVGSSGKVYGAGGDGGNGGGPTGAGNPASDGSSALGITYPCTIDNGGRIQSGYGGGGGGGGARYWIKSGKKSGGWHGSTGGGGGAGAGYPNGNGGNSPTNAYGSGSNGSDGGDGGNESSGNGGAGGNSAGAGGAGATVNNTSDWGAIGGGGSHGSGGGGRNGYAIITSQGSLPSISGNAVVGRTLTNTNPD